MSNSNNIRQRRWGRKAIVIAAIGLVVLIVSGGVAFATIPSSDGVISSCYNKSGGALRVIDAAVGKCSAGEQALTWNQTGSPGVQGPQGAKGDPGPTGPQGPPGPSPDLGYEKVYDVIHPDSFEIVNHTVQCPAGKRVLGGGYAKGLFDVDWDSPTDDNTGWQVYGRTGLVAGYLFVYAICANV